jgi:hypothetical protein
VSPYLNLALGVVHLLAWIAQRLDAADRNRVTTLLAEKGLSDAIDADLARMRRASNGVREPGADDFRD